MSLETIKAEIAKIEAAIEQVDPGAKAQIENATAAIRAEVNTIADAVIKHAEDVKTAVNG